MATADVRAEGDADSGPFTGDFTDEIIYDGDEPLTRRQNRELDNR